MLPRMKQWMLRLLLPLLCLVYLAPPAISMNDTHLAHPRRAVEVDETLAAMQNTRAPHPSPEKVIVAALEAIRANRLEEAQALIDGLLRDKPNYRLAHLIRGDLLMARARPLQNIGNASDAPIERLQDLRHEAMVRLANYTNPAPVAMVPASLMQFATAQRYAVVVDASRSRVFLYQNEKGIPRFVKDFYVTIGKLGADKVKEGDQRTPLGVYFVTGMMPRAELDRTYGAQADLYGVGAWPISYPNELDRELGKTGHGIWLHGSPADTYSRPPLASNGCVVLTNPDMTELSRYLKPGTPVIISQQQEWLPEEVWIKRRDSLLATVENWRKDWESLDTDRYLSYYSTSFRTPGMDRKTWENQKRQVNAGKKWAKVQLSDLSLFVASQPRSLMVTTFTQDYHSSNLSNRMRKRQYWEWQNNRWQIVLEAAA